MIGRIYHKWRLFGILIYIMSSASIYIDKAKGLWGHAGFQKYFQNTGWMFLGRIFGLFISFFTTIYVVRYLGPENYGVLSYAVSFIGIFSFIASFGIDQVLYRELIKYPEKTNQYLGTAFFIKLFFSSLAISLVIIFNYFLNKGEFLISLSILIISFSFIFQSFNVISYFFQAQVKSKTPVIISIIVSILINIGKVFVIFLNQGIIYLSLILLIESILNALFFIIVFNKEKNIFDWKFDWNIAKKITQDSWPFIFASAFTLIYTRIDQVMIQNMIDTKSVGIYDAAVRLTEVWYMIPNILMASLFPAMINSKNNEQKYFKRIKLVFILMLTISIVLSIGNVLFSKLIIYTLYGKEFSGSVIILSIYSFSLIGTFLGLLMNNYLLSENNKVLIFLNSFIAMALNIILNIILIPRMGMAGAAIATAISYSMVCLIPFVSKKVRSDFKKTLRS